MSAVQPEWLAYIQIGRYLHSRTQTNAGYLRDFLMFLLVLKPLLTHQLIHAAQKALRQNLLAGQFFLRWQIGPD